MKRMLRSWAEAARQRLKQMSGRERAALGVLALFVVGLVMQQLFSSIDGAFAEQQARLEKANGDRKALPFVLDRYLKLESKKKAIEQAYKEVQVVEDPLAQLESLLKSKSSVDKTFSINDVAPKRFGGSYEQHSFAVRFSIMDYPQLVELLKELVTGPKPFMLKNLRITKTRGGQRLEVDLDVSSIKRISA